MQRRPSGTRAPMPSGARELDLEPAVQRRLNAGGAIDAGVHDAAERGTQGTGGAMPFLELIQHSFGRHDVSGIQAHTDAAAAEGAQAMGAEAFAFGHHVGFAGTPSLHTAAHEAAHVVQQRAGVQLKGGVGQAGDAFEQHADAVADLVVQGRSAEALLGAPAGDGTERAVQRALVATAHGYHVDDRQGAGTQHFTNVGGASWQDQGNYRYTYTPTEELLVTHGPGGPYAPNRYWDVEHQQELTKHTGAAAANHGGGVLHIYVRNGGNVNNWNDRRTYDATHRYVPVPTNRVRWIDVNGRYVDNYDRVLAPNGEGVDKQYAVAKEGRNNVVPFKGLAEPFAPGLPGVFGGNVDPGETGNGAIGREIAEESGNGVTLNAVGGQLAQQQGAAGPGLDSNRYTFSSVAVTTQAPTAVPHEMAGSFQVTSGQFVGHTANANATKLRLLALFEQHALANPALAAYALHVQGLSPADLNTWMTSHGINVLAASITADVVSYEQGRDRARTAQAALVGANAEHQAGFQLYGQGVTDARAGLGVQNANEQAYTAGHADYLLGLTDAQLGVNAHAHAGYGTALADYHAGWQAARNGNPVPVAHAGANAHADYGLGLGHAGANQAPANNRVAYMEGYRDFI